ncbi:MmpS family transport accessory protein [Kribbella sp. NPDC026611]|uniref:MmpS family transport accessory protein n=1 Tax=Kribbella sp. NPDC026611 TaxID=3154911 RepID=UPI0033CACA8C
MSPRSRVTLIVVVGVLTCGLLVVGGLVGYVVWAQRKVSRDISYEVTGTARPTQLSYAPKDDQHSRVTVEKPTLPWSVSFHTETMLKVATVAVFLAEGETNTVTCTLRVDGKVVATETSTPGAGRMVLCSEPDD